MGLPKLILIDGPIGFGKTTVSKLLQNKLKRNVVLLSVDSFKRLVLNPEFDSKVRLNLTSSVVASMTNEFLKQGVDVIVENSFNREEHVKFFLKKIKVKSNNYFYQLDAPLKLRITRVKKRELDSEIKKLSKNKIVKSSKNYHKFRYKDVKLFDSSKLTPRKIVNRIVKDIFEGG